MRLLTLCLVLIVWGLGTPAHAEEAVWIRDPAISPDGTRIVFRHQGDLWVVPRDGGTARRLTSHLGQESSPVWSPDGKWIAFASDRHGNADVFLVSADGGPSRRLTHHSAHDAPYAFSADGGEVVFGSARQDAAGSLLPSTRLPEVYAVATEGGRPRQLSTTPAGSISFSPDGKRAAYIDVKGFENPWRKHHTSSVTRDIWVWDPAQGTHRQLTSWAGEDRDPVWSADGNAIHFLSERGGSFNVWRIPADGGDATPVTRHGPHPVRFLSTARDGTLSYAYDGGLWVLPPGGEATRLSVDISLDERLNAEDHRTVKRDATEMALSKDETEVAFVVRGDVFVASVDHGTTKRITDTPEQERSVAWAPDGRTLYYASERDGSWGLYASSIRRKEEDHFFRSTVLDERVILQDAGEDFQPLPSPDGKQIAYVRDRDAIHVLDLATGETRELVPPTRIYSYSDGDVELEWSPDGRWIAFTMFEDGPWIGAVGVVNVESGEIHNVTRSGYEEDRPHWGGGGVLAFRSNRHGRRNHGSWGSDDDVIGLYLDQEAFDRSELSEEEYDLLVKREKEEAKKKAKEERKEEGDAADDDEKADDEKDESDTKDDEDEKPPEPIEIDFDHMDDRVKRLTVHSAPIEDFAISPDGETLVYLARVGEDWGLWGTRPRTDETRRLLGLGDDEPGDVVFGKDGKAVYVRRGNGTLTKVDISGFASGKGGDGKAEDIGFSATLRVDGRAEREHLFEHVWRQAQAKFYDPELHGADWPALKAYYAAFLPQITNGHDFAELLSELLGELNASHTGAYHRPRYEDDDETASLGLLFAVGEEHPQGLVIAEVLEGGPADRADVKIEAGDVLTHIDGIPLPPAQNPWDLLDRKADQPVLLTLQPQAGGDPIEQVVRPITPREERELLYERWIRRNEAFVEQASGGRVGYVHIRGMNDASFRRVYRDVLGKNGRKEGLVVDTRFNGGGWLHDDLVTFLGGRDYVSFVPRGKELGDMGSEPVRRWSRPVVVVQSEANYSDAHAFPYAFHALGIGKLVGAPVPGTATAVWWERLIDPTLVFGIPQVGMVGNDGRYLENQELEPDVLVLPTPEDLARGEDAQLRAAVRTVIEEIDAR